MSWKIERHSKNPPNFQRLFSKESLKIFKVDILLGLFQKKKKEKNYFKRSKEN